MGQNTLGMCQSQLRTQTDFNENPFLAMQPLKVKSDISTTLAIGTQDIFADSALDLPLMCIHFSSYFLALGS